MATSPFEALNDPQRQFGHSDLLLELEKWQFLPKGTPGEVELAADLLGLRLVARAENNPWGTHYGPFASGTRSDGTEFTAPSKEDLIPDLVDMWAARARAAKHPLLRHRYADLVWDLSKLLTGKPAGVDFARLAIDGALETLATDGVKDEIDAYQVAERALDLSKSIRDPERQRAAEQRLAEYELKRAQDLRGGMWGRAFDALVLGDSSLNDATKDRLIGEMEGRLARVSNMEHGDSFDPFAAEAAAMRLASLYRRRNKADDFRRVLLKYKDAFVGISKVASGAIASAWLDEVHAALIQHGLTKDAQELEPLLRAHGKRSMDELKKVGASISISQDEIEAVYRSLTSGTTEDSLLRLADAFIPRREDIERHMRALSTNAPLLARIQIVKTDDEGRKLVSVGSQESDPEGRLFHHVAEQLKVSVPFLRAILGRAIARVPMEARLMMTQVRESPVFVESRYGLIEEGLRLLFAEQHMAAVHVLIPQIEYAIRHLAEIIGVPTLRRNKQGGLDARTLDELLKGVAGVLGDEQVLYLRVLLSDRRGWNLRNDVCHGLLPSEAFGPAMTDRVLHVLLLLTALRPARASS